MTWPPTCDYCDGRLLEPGVLVIGTPSPTLVRKLHLCADCVKCERELRPLREMLEGDR